MLIDDQITFCTAQQILATGFSEDVVDLGVPGQGAGNDLNVLAFISQAYNNLTSLTIALQSSVDAAFTAPKAHQSITVLLADLYMGKKIDLGVIPGDALRYTRLAFTVAGTAPTTGRVDATISPFGRQSFVGQP